ncbi:MAG: NAD(P)-dependent oxidoreductase [bacterium]|nr:NAD(P)-dependent oxidoreductase [bacterium]
MNVLVTGGESRLGGAVVAELASHHTLRVWGTGERPPEFGDEVKWVTGDLRDPDVAWDAVRGMKAILHTGEPPPGLPEGELEREQALLDLATRGTHVLFTAGVEAGVKRFVYGSTLEIFGAYPDDVYITEFWRPKPSPEMHQMTRYLGELTCREFARDHLVAVTALRLGKLVVEEEVGDQDPDLMWVDIRDAARAFRLALNRDAQTEVKWNRRFAVHHICADLPDGKYVVGNRWFQLQGFEPEHSFEASWKGGGA